MTDTNYTWTHGRGGRFSDPINIEFRADLTEVQNAFRTIGWHVINIPKIHDQRLIDGRVQKLQMADKPAWQWWRTRYHLRLWENMGRQITSSAHLEQYSFPGHEVLAFDDAVQEVIRGFKNLGGWQIDQNSPDLRNCTDWPADDGNLTIISKV